MAAGGRGDRWLADWLRFATDSDLFCCCCWLAADEGNCCAVCEESDARAEHVVNEDDARSRNGITGDTSYRGTVSARHYTVGKEIVSVSRPQKRFLHGRWDRELAHNSDYDVAKTLELLLHL